MCSNLEYATILDGLQPYCTKSNRDYRYTVSLQAANIYSMFDRQAAKVRFRQALSDLTRGNPQSLAQILRISPVSRVKTQSTGERTDKVQETIKSENGTDWSGILNTWLDICEASAEVSCLNCINSVYGAHLSHWLS